MFEKLAQIEKSYDELTEQISQPEFMSDMTAYARLMKQHRSLGEIVEKYRDVRKMTEDLAGAKDLAAMADPADRHGQSTPRPPGIGDRRDRRKAACRGRSPKNASAAERT